MSSNFQYSDESTNEPPPHELLVQRVQRTSGEVKRAQTHMSTISIR